jgi:hypothetical protein
MAIRKDELVDAPSCHWSAHLERWTLWEDNLGRIVALKPGETKTDEMLPLFLGGWPGLGKIDIGEHGSLEENITAVLHWKV